MTNTLLLIQGWEWIIVVLLILLLFGGKKIPELMHGLGKGVKSFKEGLNDLEEETKKEPEKKDE
jgi:sec-independent protein translocase protein TatA